MHKTIENYLQSANGAEKVLAHAKLLMKLARCYQNLAPSHLAQASRTVNYTQGTVIIHADNNAVAAKLRQLAGTLAEGFSRNGWKCSDIQVKVQVHENPEQLHKTAPRNLNNEAITELERLRDSLADSPLGEAVGNLIKRAARESSGKC